MSEPSYPNECCQSAADCSCRDPYEPPVPDVAERDDVAGVDWLAWAMKRKLAAKRAEGYGGWNDPERCTVEHLAQLFMEHLPKGDMVDIANFTMMLYRREGGAEALKAAVSASQPPVPHVEGDGSRDG